MEKLGGPIRARRTGIKVIKVNLGKKKLDKTNIKLKHEKILKKRDLGLFPEDHLAVAVTGVAGDGRRDAGGGAAAATRRRRRRLGQRRRVVATDAGVVGLRRHLRSNDQRRSIKSFSPS